GGGVWGGGRGGGRVGGGRWGAGWGGRAAPGGPVAEGGALSQKAPAEEKVKKGMMFDLSKMMEDPGMAAMIEQQQGVMIDGMFGPLFSELGLSEEDSSAVRALILEKQMVATRLGLQMMNEDLSKEEQKELGDAIKAETDRVNAAIKETLGDEGYAEFELFEKSQPERQALQAYKQSLSGQGIDLSFDQEEELMSAMYEERTSFNFSTGDFGDQTKNDPELLDKFTEANVDQYLGEYRQLQDRIVERASGILSEDQLEAFKANQESMVKMQEMGMRMGLGMMGKRGEGGEQQ
ncbi:MAG: hypothetical protein AAF591_11260, partial [Verrucomicrobiota bacterium]